MDAERVFVPTGNGQFVALDRETGVTAWAVALSTALAPVTSGSVLVAGSADAVVGLDPATGAQRWSAPTEADPARAIGLSPDGRTVIVVGRARVQALRTDTGAELWRRDLATTDDALRLAIDREAAYLTTGGGRLVSISMHDGGGRWDREFPGTLSQPVVIGGRVFVGSSANAFHALDAATGKVQWTWRTGGDVIGAAGDERYVYLVGLDNVLKAINRGNGHQRWKQALTTRPVAPPVVLPGHVVVAGIDPALASFEALTGAADGTFDGQTAGSSGAPVEIIGPPLVDPAMRPFRVSLVLVWRDGRVTGLRPTSMLFREPAPAPFTALPGRVLAREAAVPTAPATVAPRAP